MKDLYKTLGVAENADEATIKKAYRKLAKEFHPDVTGGRQEEGLSAFKEIQRGLRRPGRQGEAREYERLRHAPVRPDGMPEGFDADAFARTFGGMRGGPRRSQLRRRRRSRRPLLDPVRRGRGAPRLAVRRARGSARRAGPTSSAPCPSPSPRRRWGRAAACARGAVRPSRSRCPPASRAAAACACPATASRRPPRRLPRGSLLEIEVRPDPHLVRNGSDIELDVPVTFSEAGLGTKVQVPTVEGPVTVTVPPGTSSGSRLRLRGKGVKRPDGSRGDQLVRVEIVAPKGAADDPETRKLLEDLAKRTEHKSPRSF